MENTKGVTTLQESHEDEVIHLFEVMKKYKSRCGIEIQTETNCDPLLSSLYHPVNNVEYFQRESGPADAVLLQLGDLEFGFDVGTHAYAKHVSDCQIFISVSASDSYCVWFTSDALPASAIEEARSYAPPSDPDESIVEDFPGIIAEFVRYLDFKGLSDDFNAWRTQPEAGQE